MIKNLVSIIVPVYNVEEYLEQCIESILKQTYNDFELLLIDDGSSDSSGKICDKYAKKSKKIKCFHKINEGVSIARNLGINHSKGEYIVFIDSDDYINEKYLEHMINYIKKRNVDVCICNFDYLINDKIETHSMEINEKKYSYIDVICNPKSGSGYLWNKIYKSEIIKNNSIFFRKNIKIMEDLIFNIEIANTNIKYAYIDEALYIYRQRNGSALNTKFKFYNCFDALAEIISLTEGKSKYYNDYKLKFIFEYYKNVFKDKDKSLSKELSELKSKYICNYLKLDVFLNHGKFQIKLKTLFLILYLKVTGVFK